MKNFFRTLESGDELEVGDSASLTLLLQDCLGARYPDWCDAFSCSWTSPDHLVTSLSGLSVHLTISWPLTIILSQKNLETYNKIFVFLSEVKRSLWALQSVSLADLEDLEDRMEGREDLSISCLSVNQSMSEMSADKSLCLGAKQHRLQLLRSWLIYFTSTIHGYFMSRVVHTTEIELQAQLQPEKILMCKYNMVHKNAAILGKNCSGKQEKKPKCLSLNYCFFYNNTLV